MLSLLSTFAQDYTYTYTDTSSSSGGGTFVVLMLFYLAIAVLMFAAWWKIFKKAGEPGWAAIVPFYNYIVILRIVGRPWWWFLLLFVPIVNIVISVIVINDLAKSFGKDVGYTLLLLFVGVVGLPILAFGDAQYQGPAGPEKGNKQAPAPTTPSASGPVNPTPPTPPATPPTVQG